MTDRAACRLVRSFIETRFGPFRTIKYVGEDDGASRGLDAPYLLTTLSDKRIVKWASKLLSETRQLFKAYHTKGERAQANAKAKILKRLRRPPPRGDARTLADRIKHHADAYFRFLENDAVEPTNNKAERALRHAVIDRRITQGTRGETGSRWLERFLTIRETCRQQHRPLFDYLIQTITRHTTGQSAPTLSA